MAAGGSLTPSSPASRNSRPLSEAFLIRRAVPEDFAQWLPLWDGYNEFYGRTGPTALPSYITASTWRRFFEVDEPMHALVAESEGELIGFAHYLFHRSTTSMTPTCYLRDLYTAQATRGAGVATALIGLVCDEARSAGSPDVYWQAHETNEVARKLYDKIAEPSGFVVYQKSV
jgi:GNAT superfamily N-acetyltransferase